MQKELAKIKRKLLPVVYRNILLEKKRTHVLDEQNQGEFVFYVDGQATYLMALDDTMHEIEKWASAHKGDVWRIIKRIHRLFDARISGPPLLATVFDWNSRSQGEEVELTLIPMHELWSNLTEEDKLKLLK